MILQKTIESLGIGGKIYLSVNSIVLLMGIIFIVLFWILVIEVKIIRRILVKKYSGKTS